MQLNLALSYHEAGKLAEADTMLSAVLEASPDWEPAVRAAAITSLKRGHLEASLAHHQKLIETGHAEAEVFFNAALLAEQVGNSASAYLYYTKALELRNDFVEALVSLGHMLDDQGRSSEARTHWAKAMELRPSLANEYFSTPVSALSA